MSAFPLAGTTSASFQAFRTFVFVVILSMAVVYMMTPVLIPVIISLTLYALFEPATQYLVRHNINHSLSILIVLLLLVFVSFLAIGFALPQLFEQAGLLQAKLPQIMTRFEAFISAYSRQITELVGAEFDASDIIMKTLSESSSVVQTLLLSLSGKLINMVIFMLLVPFLTYYLLKDFRSVRNSLMNWLPNSSFELGWIISHDPLPLPLGNFGLPHPKSVYADFVHRLFITSTITRPVSATHLVASTRNPDKLHTGNGFLPNLASSWSARLCDGRVRRDD